MTHPGVGALTARWRRRRSRCAAIPTGGEGNVHLAMRRERAIAKIAMARRLAVRLYWMWRNGCDYTHLPKLGSHAGQPGNRLGAQ